MSNLAQALVNNLRARLAERQWNDSKFADELGVTRQNVSQWMNLRRTPSLENLQRFAEVLGTTVADLLRPVPHPIEKKLRELHEALGGVRARLADLRIHHRGLRNALAHGVAVETKAVQDAEAELHFEVGRLAGIQEEIELLEREYPQFASTGSAGPELAQINAALGLLRSNTAALVAIYHEVERWLEAPPSALSAPEPAPELEREVPDLSRVPRPILEALSGADQAQMAAVYAVFGLELPDELRPRPNTKAKKQVR